MTIAKTRSITSVSAILYVEFNHFPKGAVVFILMFLLFGGLLTSLIVTQYILLSKGITTYEYLKEYYLDFDNPFHKSCFINHKEFWFKKLTPEPLLIKM